MKTYIVLLLCFVYLSADKFTHRESETRLEEVLRGLEHEERAETNEEIKSRTSHRSYHRKDVSVEQDRRGSTSGGGGISFDVNELQRKNTECLHRNNKNNNNSGGREKRQAGSCYEVRACDDSDKIYRSADGSCNNLANPNWGKAGIPLTRFTANKYEDGLSLPRSTGVGGGDLPLARLVSTTVHRDDTQGTFTDAKRTHMTMQWGQFLAHDYASTPTQSDGVNPVCCVEDLPDTLEGAKCITQDELNSAACLPIFIPDDDHHFITRKCMHFVRSMQAVPFDCQSEHKEQLNAISTFIDASNVYGSTDDYMKSLRTESKGRLKTSANDLLPHDVDGLNCVKDSDTDDCFKAGDARVNVQPGLASMHTIFLRLHNNITSFLAANNPKWLDERLFQEARKIVAALMQHITYDEWLRVILGDEMANHAIAPTPSGFNTVYDSTVDPRLATEFATAAGRFGHSMIQSTMSRILGSFSEATRMSSLYGRTKYVTEENGEGLSRLVNGLVKDNPESADDWYSTEVSDRLFEVSNENSLDLAALNIQRGRDHGIPSYNDMREFCGLSRATRFDTRDGGFVDHGDGPVRRFQRVYASPDDVDLYTGGVSERRVRRGQIGPLFACLNGRQFEALRRGDRFWYENENSESGFSLDQLNAIKRVRLSRVICDTTHITTIQQNVFEQVNKRNKDVSCDDTALLPELDLTPWIA